MVNGYRFIGIAPEVDLTERRSKMINDQTEPFTFDDMRGYKSFTAFLTQSGSGNIYFIFSGDLIIGATYFINDIFEGMDFTNVGAPNNNLGTYFIATGSTPNSWGANPLEDAVLGSDTGAPVATVLENTIGNVWFTYESEGVYLMNSNGLFPNYKTWGISDSIKDNNAVLQPVMIDVGGFGPDKIYIRAQGGDFNGDSMLANTPIEIKVYN